MTPSDEVSETLTQTPTSTGNTNSPEELVNINGMPSNVNFTKHTKRKSKKNVENFSSKNPKSKKFFEFLFLYDHFPVIKALEVFILLMNW